VIARRVFLKSAAGASLPGAAEKAKELLVREAEPDDAGSPLEALAES